MKNPFDWHHSLLYADKSREEYTMEKEGTLDHLLYQMYMVAHDSDGLNMSSAIKALNTAYYLAVAIYNTPHVEEKNNVGKLTYGRVRDILAEEHPKGCVDVSEADIFLVRWMAWAILKLQSAKPTGLDAFLDKFKSLIAWDEDRYSYVRDDYGDFFEQEHIKSVREQWLECAFVRNFPKMVEEVGDVKFYTDLQPNAQLPDLIPEKIFEEQIKGLSYEEIEQLLTHYRSKKYQLVLLEFAKQYEYWRDNVESAIVW